MSRFNTKNNRDLHSPLVSIVVLAYNHLDYTRQCIESLYKYTTEVDYELITIDNGSTDQTEVYFNSLPNEKKIRFPENIGVDKAINYGFKIAEGKYTLNLSNDIIVTHHWLSNLITCMESDQKIAMVVPVCGFSSNHQQVDLVYDSIDEMQILMKTYNKSDPNLWEERMKLVTYTCLFRTDVQKSIGGFDEDFNPGAYDDDAISFQIRRSGYKLILAKDTYVHHFGSITFNAEYAKNNIAVRNRLLFIQKFGLDSWIASMIDFNIVEMVDYDKSQVSILGVGSSCGSSLLQVKNRFRNKGIYDVKLHYLSQEERCMSDLASICESCKLGVPENIKDEFPYQFHDIIIVESETDKIENLESFYTELSSILQEDGQLITTAANQNLYLRIEKILMDQGYENSRNINNYYYSFTKQK